MTSKHTPRAITMAPTDTIALYERTAREFLRSVLEQDWDECLITDESNLSDFASCGLPEHLARNTTSLATLYAAWDAWVVPTICARYGIEPFSPAIRLVELFSRIERGRTLLQ